MVDLPLPPDASRLRELEEWLKEQQPDSPTVSTWVELQRAAVKAVLEPIRTIGYRLEEITDSNDQVKARVIHTNQCPRGRGADVPGFSAGKALADGARACQHCNPKHALREQSAARDPDGNY